MKLISLNEWCSVTESDKGPDGPLEPVPQQLKDLCISPDPAMRELAVYQLPNYDPKDPFFKEWSIFLKKHDFVLLGISMEEWIFGRPVEVEIEKVFHTALNIGIVYEGIIYGFSTDNSKLEPLIKNNIENGKFRLPFCKDWPGNFYCGGESLVSLEGCPEKVAGYFNCSNNLLKSLAGCPSIVGGAFMCVANKLTSLKGCPTEITDDFICDLNELTTLEGCPQEVGGKFSCAANNLTTLVGCPKRVSANFNCSKNKLTSLEGAPVEVGGAFSCSENELVDLEHAPEKVGSGFNCMYNKLTSLAGAPKTVGGDFFCTHNPTRFTAEQVRAVSKVGKHIHC